MCGQCKCAFMTQTDLPPECVLSIVVHYTSPEYNSRSAVKSTLLGFITVLTSTSSRLLCVCETTCAVNQENHLLIWQSCINLLKLDS